MLEFAIIITGLVGVYGMFKILILKGNVLRPELVEKWGERKAQIIGLVFSASISILAFIALMVVLGS